MMLSRGSVAQLVTGISVPLEESSDLAIDARFGHLLRVGATESKNDEDCIYDKGDDAALQELQILHSSQGTTTEQTLVQACVRVLATQVARLLRLESRLGH
ncbi:hypothetical protein F4805DRAFT_259647 [Annulohypoxylon moriforme]|nr:hypothetical protein F4805DRAFT_259647 [Annulohypoxylon moriforme]